MHVSPYFPLSINTFGSFGLILLLGLIGGELARHVKFLPRIFGYIIVGFLIGPGGFNIVSPSLLVDTRIFVDISLGLIMFELGRQLDFVWLRHDRGLLLTSLTESGLTLVLVFSVLSLLGLAWLPAILAATIAMVTSPAVVMLVANDLASEGPVTRRTLILTSLNNLFGLIIFTLLLPMAVQPVETLSVSKHILFNHAAYQLFASFILGFTMFVVARYLAFLTGKREESQFILFVGVVVLTISLATALNISTMLSLFTFGVAARNLDRRKHMLMEVDFGWLARLFLILLFVITGVHLQLKGLWLAPSVVLAFLIARSFAKSVGVWLFSKKSRLTRKQAIAIGFALTPMAGVAVGMSDILADFNPDLGRQLAIMITSALAILNFLGPIATQLAFIETNEALSEK